MSAEHTTVAELASDSGVVFGTSGARGLVSAMTDRVCHGYTTGFLQFMMEEGAWSPGARVALAGDLRTSTPRILRACAQAVSDLGGVPVFCGLVPTPALATWAFQVCIPSLMVTGSHIPDDRNGIKFFRPQGEVLKSDETGVLRQRVGPGHGRWTDDGALVDPPALLQTADINQVYLARYVDVFGSSALSGLRLGIYQHSAVGRDLLVEIFSALGAEVLPLGRANKFIPVDTEAVRQEDTMLAQQWTRELGLDAIVSTDGDSDRPLLADHNGTWIRGDVLGIMCARALGAQSVVTSVSSNTVVESCGAFGKVHRTRIGSPYVIATMNGAINAGERLVCGYEANGGFILGSDVTLNAHVLRALPTRDAVLPMIAALIAARPGRLADLAGTLPPRFTHSDRLLDFSARRLNELMEWMQWQGEERANQHLDETFGQIAGAAMVDRCDMDGLRLTFANKRIIHLRGSGNAPELRCYTEAETNAAAEQLCNAILVWVAKHFP